MRLALLALLALAPTASALDALPGAWGDRDATLVVRAAEWLRVDAKPPVEVQGHGATPVELPARGAWHGLAGAVELRLARADASQAVRVEVSDETGAGIVTTWPAAAARDAPGPGLALILAAGAVGSRAAASRRGAGSRSASPCGS